MDRQRTMKLHVLIEHSHGGNATVLGVFTTHSNAKVWGNDHKVRPKAFLRCYLTDLDEAFDMEHGEPVNSR